METTVRELADHLYEYLRRAQAGEEFTVTDDGKPIARVVPATPARTEEEIEKEALARLDAMPWIRPGSGEKLTLPEPLMRIGPGEKTLAEIVSEMRE